MTLAVLLDIIDLLIGISQSCQCLVHRLVDDLEVAATCKLLVLHDREIGLDSSCIAIHHQADCTRRGNDGCLSVTISMLLPKSKGSIPCSASCLHKVGWAQFLADTHGRYC